VLLREGPPEESQWAASFMAMLHMANDSGLFRTREQLVADRGRLAGDVFTRGGERWLPLYEAKMVHLFDHRFGTYEGQTQAQANKGFLPYLDDAQHADPTLLALPRYWVPEVEVEDRLAGKWPRGWLLGWRDITGVEKARTVIASIVPRVGVAHTMPLMFPMTADTQLIAVLYASLCSFVFDYVARQKIGGTHLTYSYLNQLPVLPPATYGSETSWSRRAKLDGWLRDRVLELTYTAWDLEAWAKDLGWDGPPFRWDEPRRFLLRCELDAAFFHLYGIDRDDTAYILDTFPIVARKDDQAHGEYRTKRVILEIYDAMQKAIDTGVPYETRLDPPPADSRVTHPVEGTQ
jgi:hypothetical protein